MLILPSGYRKLNYIRSAGTQYIDTGFTPNQDTRVVAVCRLLSPATGPAQHLFSSRQSVAVRAFAFYGYEGNYRSVYGTSNQLANSGEIDGPFQVDFDKNVLKIDGVVKITHAEQTFVCPGPLYLFAGNNNGTTVNYAAANLYSCQIYDNGALVRDYVPCIDPSGAAGLYDTVEGKFYSNSGTGTFEAGFEFAAQEAMLKAIADAIREKDGTTALIPAMNFPERIRTIPEGGVNANLLDNWYFGNPVNRQGEDTYEYISYSQNFAIDCWRLRECNTLSLLDGCVQLTAQGIGAADVFPSMNQSLMNFEKLYGKTLTLSVLILDAHTSHGEVGLFFANYPNYHSARIGEVVSITKPGLYSASITIPESSTYRYCNFVIRMGRPADGEWIKVIAAKLELGNRQTLVHQDADGNWVLNEIPNFAAEYAKCAQYDLATGNWVGYSQIAVKTSDPASGSVSGGGLASNGVTMTVKASAADGYRFAGWQESGQTVSEEAEYTFTVSGGRELTAVFEPVS